MTDKLAEIRVRSLEPYLGSVNQFDQLRWDVQDLLQRISVKSVLLRSGFERITELEQERERDAEILFELGTQLRTMREALKCVKYALQNPASDQKFALRACEQALASLGAPAQPEGLT